MQKTLLIASLAIFVSSCASIVSKSSSPVIINSTPREAAVEVFDRNGVSIYSGRTPAHLTLKHSNGFFKRAIYRVKISLEGYESREVTIDSHVNGWYFGNLLFGGVIGFLIVDPLTGAMYKLDTQDVDETLAAKASGASLQPAIPSLQIVTLNSIPENLRKDLVRLP